jgi:hypothetical protein
VAIMGGGEGPTNRRTLTQWPSSGRVTNSRVPGLVCIYICVCVCVYVYLYVYSIYIYLSIYRSGTQRGLQPATSGVYIYTPRSSTTRHRIATTAVIAATERVELLNTVFVVVNIYFISLSI